MDFHCFKEFDKARTGGQMVSECIINALGRIGNVHMHTFDWYDEDNIFLRSLIMRKEYRMAKQLVNERHFVYGVGEIGTFDYVGPPIEFRGSLIGRIQNIGKKTIGRILWQKDDNLKLVAYCSEYIRRKFVSAGHIDGKVIFPPAFRNYNNDLSKKGDLILTLSRISPEKNIELVGEISNNFRNEADFVVMGYMEPRNRKYLESLQNVYPNLKIQTDVSEQEKYDTLSRAKILFHPTINEPWGITKIEGMSAGAYPLVHNSGGSPEGIPREFVFSDFEDASQRISVFLQNYSVNKARELMGIANKFNSQDFENTIIQLISDVKVMRREENQSKD